MRQLTSKPRAELLPALLIPLFLASLNWSLALLKSEENSTAQANHPEANTNSADSSRKTTPEDKLIDSQSATASKKEDQPKAIHYSDRGVSKFHSGDKAGAIRDHSNAIAINPEFAMAYYNRDDANRHLGDYKGAIQDFSLSLRLKPGYAEAWGNRGLVKTNPGNKPGGARTSREVRI